MDCVGETLGAMGIFVFEIISTGRVSSFADVAVESFINSCVSFVLNLILLHSVFTVLSSTSTLSSERI